MVTVKLTFTHFTQNRFFAKQALISIALQILRCLKVSSHAYQGTAAESRDSLRQNIPSLLSNVIRHHHYNLLAKQHD